MSPQKSAVTRRRNSRSGRISSNEAMALLLGGILARLEAIESQRAIRAAYLRALGLETTP